MRQVEAVSRNGSEYQWSRIGRCVGDLVAPTHRRRHKNGGEIRNQGAIWVGRNEPNGDW